MTATLFDPDAERVLLATILALPAGLDRLLATDGLLPEHFGIDTNATAFGALVALNDRGDHIDHLTFAAELERAGLTEPQRVVTSIAAEMPALGGTHTYAHRLRDLHRRRQLRVAAALLGEAADTGDPDRLAQAEEILTTPPETEPMTWSGNQLAERFQDRLDEPKPEVFAWPFAKLNAWTGGGLRRKQIVLIGGWTSMGKSIVYDQILETMAAQGLRCHSYINEMSEPERMDRTMARLSGVPFGSIYRRDLDGEQETELLAALAKVRVGLTEAHGWTAQEIARHIKWNRWDVAGVDIIHEIAHREERDLAEIAQVLRSTAKQVGCALISCVHLNDQRVTSPQRPIPVLRDVRGSGMLVRGADVVLFIHRDDDQDGVPQADGALVAAKVRNGHPEMMKVHFDPNRMRFTERIGV